MDSQTKQALHRILRVILGALFIFSGFVKCVDPTGGAIKIEDYFVAWGWGGSPWWLCMALSVVQNIVEFTAGFMLVCGSIVPLASFVTLAFMVFFTPLTLYIAIAMPSKLLIGRLLARTYSSLPRQFSSSYGGTLTATEASDGSRWR